MKKIIILSVFLSLLSCSKVIEKKQKSGTSTEEERVVYQEVSIPASLEKYYQEVDFSKKGEDLFDALAVLTIAKHSNILTYNQRHQYLEKADASSERNTLLLVYSAEKVSVGSSVYDTEHIYPQSLLKGGKNSKGYADLHHLRYCKKSDNSTRGNKPFTDANGKSRTVGSYWYPGDEWRGDVARMLLYLKLRYNEDMNKVSTDGIDLLLKWNAEDPVSEFEKQRNEVIFKAQGNRNPFIDNPYLATKIWNGQEAENHWKAN